MESPDKQIRRLRKKLRQIENLELLPRALNEEELAKIQKKDSIRSELASLLKQHGKTLASYESPKTTSAENADYLSPTNKASKDVEELKRLNAATSALPEVLKKKKTEADEPTGEVEKHITENEEEIKTDEETSNKSVHSKTKVQSKPPLFWTHKFEGHSDLVTSVTVNDDYLISASRDTCIKIWNLETDSEPNELRGHSNFITAVKLLPREFSGSIKTSGNNPTLLSVSLDCCVKLWDVVDRKMLRSIYTFNGITSLDFIKGSSHFAIGTEGGKIEIYDLNSESNSPVWSDKAFTDSVTSLQVTQEHMYAASLDGTIAVWELDMNYLVNLRLVYRSEDLTTETGVIVPQRPVRSLHVPGSPDLIYFGDEGSNVKVLNWKKDNVRKLANHVTGVTNSITSSGDLLFISSFDLETGVSSVNVRSLPDKQYLYTLSLQKQTRILSVSALHDKAQDLLRIAVGGSELYVWESMNPNMKINSASCKTLAPTIQLRLSCPAEDTEDSDSSITEADEDDEPHNEDTAISGNDQKSWCLVM